MQTEMNVNLISGDQMVGRLKIGLSDNRLCVYEQKPSMELFQSPICHSSFVFSLVLSRHMIFLTSAH